MCLAVPGQVKKIYEQAGLKMGLVDFGGVFKEVCLAYLPDLTVGEYVIVHVGFAINRLDEKAALKSLAFLGQIGQLSEELGPEAEAASKYL